MHHVIARMGAFRRRMQVGDRFDVRELNHTVGHGVVQSIARG